ncbi:MAG: HD domain-containing phosphohydrolase [Candidatus Neomarinimicrobiota bacterium]
MAEDPKPKNYCILIADDLPSNLAYFNEALSTFGYRTLTAADGREALEQVSSQRPDLILSDVNMPNMDGFQLSSAIKGNPQTCDIPVILVTAMDDRESLAKGLSSGVDDFLIKPVNLSELQARVRNLLLVKDYRDHMHRYTAELEEQVTARTAELKAAFEQLSRANDQLRTASLDTIQKLSTAAEYRDTDTAAHIWRMSHYSGLLARQLALGDEFVDSILYASPMHDIGKIGTPDNILLKPGKFNADEARVMQKHTKIGEQILGISDQPLLTMAREIAGGHHEKWDGSGYPRGLVGEAIPLSARVVALADVYDALTTERVYKAAWEPEEAFKYIQANAGSHFDPVCAEAFGSIRDQIIDLQQSVRKQRLDIEALLSEDI